MATIDLNADLGEHEDSSLDAAIMPFISSCNIACGGHAGDEISVRETVRLAKEHNVAIGAHPGYPDRPNFGRVVMQIDKNPLRDSIREQVLLVKTVCEEEEVPLHHVKPHGALYNAAAASEELSDLICEVVSEVHDGVKLYGLAHSKSEQAAMKYGLPFIPEGFADRQYEADRTLRSRALTGAVLTDIDQVLSQVYELANNHRAKAEDWVSITAQTICLHGDTEGAITLSQKINMHLVDQGIHIAAV